jgi:ArsR family transcriptional regulator
MSKYRSERRIAEAAGRLKALGHPHRLRIYLRLLECCGGRPCRGTEEEVARCVGDLGQNLGISPSTLSHHLKELRGAGLIRMERNGQRVECGVDPAALRALADLLEELTAASAAESGACS